MKKQYLKPSLEVVEIQQQCNILAGSITGIDGDADIGYGGGGTVTPMAPELGDDFDFYGLVGL